MLTRSGTTLLFAGLALLASGLAVGNAFYLGLALVPLGYALVALATEPPRGVEATLETTTYAPRVGEKFVVNARIRVARGVGGVDVQVVLPDAFEVVEGHDIRLFRKRAFRPLDETFALTVRPLRRGAMTVGPLRVERVHALAFRGPGMTDAAEAVDVEVRPLPDAARRIRAMPGIARQLFPENDAAKTGIQTNDFEELREYVSGDPIKSINWRGSARRPAFHQGTAPPLVNEYEHEGKKSVWVFLDAAPYMRLGTSLDNSFEHAVQAATSIATFYADRGYRLGAAVYNAKGQPFLHPDVGRRQILRWQRLATHLEPGEDAEEGLSGAVERVHRYLLQEKPLIVIVTRAGKADEKLFDGLRRLRALTGRRRRRLPILLASPIVQAHVPLDREYAGDLVALARLHDRPAVQRIRRQGVRVIEWDATRTRFESALLRGTGGGRT